MIGVIGIILSLGLLMYLAYRGISVIILAPVLALFAVLLGSIGTGNAHLMATYTEVFMVSLGGYVKSYFPVFLLGALFGKLMDDSGSAQAISEFIVRKIGKKREVLAIVLSCAVLTYGGVSLFVVAFAAYPIAAALFREADLPKRFIPACIALGAFTFTMTGLPGTPQIQNAIPMQYFGTDAYAAPILGIVGSAIMLGGGLFWITTRIKKAVEKGEGYGEHKNETFVKSSRTNLPSFGTAVLPILIVLVANFVISRYIIPMSDSSYLENYGTVIGKVSGNWSLITALILAILVAMAINFKRFDNLLLSINNGVQGSFLAIMNTASEVGYGNVISALAAFGIVKVFLLGISSNPLISEAISVSVLAGITGSASGGLSIALSTLGDTFLETAKQIGLNPQVLHRVASIACGGLDTLPHNGAVITLLGITGLTHRQSYADIGMCTVVIPTVAVIAIIILGSMGVV